MTVSVALSPEVEILLRERATAAGKDLGILASELLSRVLTHGLTRDYLRQISGNTYDRFLASGLTDEQLGDDLERAKHQARETKRGISFDE